MRLLNAGLVEPELKSAEELLAWLKPKAGSIITLTEIYQTGPNPLRSAGTARRTLGILIEHGYMAQVAGGGEFQGKRCREAYRRGGPMTDLFVFDVDSFLEAGAAANVANPANVTSKQCIKVANDLLTVANVPANPEPTRSTLAGISKTLANPKPAPEANNSDISNISRGKPSDSVFSFTAAEAALNQSSQD